uniref:Uncharacterized protein LOC111111518 n=1 Tax=Crassostrea virginica TaxID=6565 RepID=A0A8B8BMV4_CRAVI|nr:uncharacterized protein LOC111111518 [Crassostrea virginica]
MGIFTLAAGVISFLTVYTIVGHVECKLDRALSNKTGHLFIDGIDASHLSKKEFNKLLEEEDDKFMDSLSIWIGKHTLREKQRLKRAPLRYVGAWKAARRLYKSVFSTKPKITQSGNRITKHFSKPGNYETALNDFESFFPTDIQIIDKNGQEGFYGDILDGEYTLTVRKTSSNGQPTLQLIPRNGFVFRKLRYIDYRE